MKLSVVATLYNRSSALAEFHARICAASEAITENVEIVLVNDGSSDSSLDDAIALSERDARVLVIDLSRNFGHHKAIMTGLEAASGDLVFLIDSDLEEPPEILRDFYKVLQAERCDVVYGYQERRERGILDLVSGELFYWIVNLVSALRVPRNLITARLMTRRYVRSLLRFREREIFLAGLWVSTGYKQIGLPVQKGSGGASSYTVWHRLSLTLTSLISFSNRPLTFAALVGAVISIFSALFILYLIIRRSVENMAAGWASIVASIWFMGGLTIFFVGLVGIYISKIFVEVKQRPYTIIRDIYRAGQRQALEGDEP